MVQLGTQQEVFVVFADLVFEEAEFEVANGNTPSPLAEPPLDENNHFPNESDGLSLLPLAAAGGGYSAGEHPLSPTSVVQESVRMLQVMCAV